MWKSLHLNKGVLYRKDPNTGQSQLVVPLKMKHQILKQVHNHPLGGHFGIKKTLYNIQVRFWWPGLRADVIRWCRTCSAFQRRNPRCSDNKCNWDEHLPYLMCAYRATINESSGCSPNLVMLRSHIASGYYVSNPWTAEGVHLYSRIRRMVKTNITWLLWGCAKPFISLLVGRKTTMTSK